MSPILYSRHLVASPWASLLAWNTKPKKNKKTKKQTPTPIYIPGETGRTIPIHSPSHLTALVSQQYWWSRLPVGNTHVWKPEDSKMALYLVSDSPNCSLWIVLLLQGISRKHSCLHSWRPSILGRTLYLVSAPHSYNPQAVLPTQRPRRRHDCTSGDPARTLQAIPTPLATVRNQFCPSSNPVGDMPIYAYRAKSTNHNVGCGIWKIHCSESVLPTQGLIQWPGSCSPTNLMDAIPTIYLEIHPLRTQIWALVQVAASWKRYWRPSYPTRNQKEFTPACALVMSPQTTDPITDLATALQLAPVQHNCIPQVILSAQGTNIRRSSYSEISL